MSEWRAWREVGERRGGSGRVPSGSRLVAVDKAWMYGYAVRATKNPVIIQRRE